MTAKEWAIDHVGDGYIYGSKGQTCSASFRKQQAQQYPAQTDNILNVGAKWDGKTVWDCAQFTRYALKNAGINLVSGATSQYNSDVWSEKGTVDRMPDNVLCCVFRQSGGKMQHTGLYLGDGTVVHAQGTKTGVIRQKFTEYPWTHYAIPGEEKPMEVEYNARVVAQSGTTVNMRKEATKESERVCSVPLGQIVDVYEDGAQWLYIGWNGKKGYMMRKYL